MHIKNLSKEFQIDLFECNIFYFDPKFKEKLFDKWKQLLLKIHSKLKISVGNMQVSWVLVFLGIVALNTLQVSGISLILTGNIFSIGPPQTSFYVLTFNTNSFL